MQSSSRILSAGTALVCAVLMCAALAPPAAAHHSFAAAYDMGTNTEIEGRVTNIRWVNPHVKIYVDARNGQSWEIEAGPVNLLSRMGIEKSMLKVGETIRVRGNPGRGNARMLWVSNILLSDKTTELLVAPGAQPYRAWASKKTVGNPNALSEPGDRTAGTERTFFHIWEPLDLERFPKPRGEPVLTDAGQRAQARYKSGKQAIADCEVPGMPFAMMSPYPMEIVRQGDRLLIRGEAYDLRRVVNLAAPASPPAPSPLGLSVGRIMGDELIVETSRINYHSYGDLGPAQSAQSHVVERFKLSADGLKLDYEITVTDPVMLAKPWSWGGSFVSRKGAVIKPWNCGKDRG
jgi:hypothetical protein